MTEVTGMGKAKWQQLQERRTQAVEQRFRLECQRYQDWEVMADRIRALAPKAAEALAKALDGPDPDPRVALAILKLTLDRLQPTIPSRALIELNADRYLLGPDEDQHERGG
jgi:hypothetical protein